MQITFIRVDGLHIAVQATLAQVAQDQDLLLFADGLLSKSVATLAATAHAQWTIAEVLFQDVAQTWPFLTVLLALDAEIILYVRDKQRVIPLPGFLSYRAQFLPEQVALSMVRFPPLNPDGHYLFAPITGGGHIAMRLDIHPKLRVCGHVRIAISGPDCLPKRLHAMEHRLERQELTPAIITETLTIGNAHLPVALRDDVAALLTMHLLRLCNT